MPVRTIAAWVLTAAAAIAVAASVVAWWAHRTVLETDAFVTAVTPAVESESVRVAIADRVSDELITALELETRVADVVQRASSEVKAGLADALELSEQQAARLEAVDFGIRALAGPIADGLEARIRGAVTAFVSSPAANDLLLDTIEGAHERIVLLLRDELDQLPNVVVAEGEVRLDLVPLMAEALRATINAGVNVIGVERQIPPFDSAAEARQAIERLAAATGRELDPDFGQARLTSEAQLDQAQRLVQAFDRLVWALPLLALLLGIGSVVLAPSIPTGLVRLGIASAVAVFLGWVAIELLRQAVVDAAQTPSGRDALADVTRAIVASLQPLAAALVIIGIGAAVAGFAMGRTRA